MHHLVSSRKMLFGTLHHGSCAVNTVILGDVLNSTLSTYAVGGHDLACFYLRQRAPAAAHLVA